MKIPRLPHRNLIDNLHHARNITVPGSVDALYTTTFTISPPQGKNLGTHHDWHQKVGYLNEESTFTYQDLLFDEVSKKIRKKTKWYLLRLLSMPWGANRHSLAVLI